MIGRMRYLPSRLFFYVLFGVGRIRYEVRNFFRIHPGVTLTVQASPSTCIKLLETTATPSTKRLQHRELFREGRRYIVEELESGFKVTTTRKVIWNRRRRTSRSIIIMGKFTRIDDDSTQITLKSRMTLLYFLMQFLIPTYATVVIWATTWSRDIVIAAALAMYALSWLGRRFHAQLETHEMIRFIKTAFDHFIERDVAKLEARAPDVITQKDFPQVWERFYEDHAEID